MTKETIEIEVVDEANVKEFKKRVEDLSRKGFEIERTNITIIEDSDYNYPTIHQAIMIKYLSHSREFPCNILCPQCGSRNISLEYKKMGRNLEYSEKKLDKTYIKDKARSDLWQSFGIVSEDHLQCTCKHCQYNWSILPLSKRPVEEVPNIANEYNKYDLLDKEYDLDEAMRSKKQMDADEYNKFVNAPRICIKCKHCSPENERHNILWCNAFEDKINGKAILCNTARNPNNDMCGEEGRYYEPIDI